MHIPFRFFSANNSIAWKGRPRCLYLKTKLALSSLLLLLLLGNGCKVGCRRHRSELQHQVMRQWRWHLRYTGRRGAVPRLNPVARRISVESLLIDGRWKLKVTDCCRPWINVDIHASAVPPTPYDFCNLVRRMSWSRVSKAALRSSNPSSFTRAESAASRISEKILKRAVSVECPCL